MQHQFSQVPNAEIQRSTFDRTHGHKTTFDAGYLIPFYIDEALPGDTFNVRATLFSRLATPIFPIMDNMFMDTQFFAVPMRLLWENWERFNGAQTDPGDSTDYVCPTMTTTSGFTEGSLSDYFGIPVGIAGLEVNSFWHRAYNLIWNEWYRDQNLQDSVVVDVDDGPDDEADYVLLRRGKRHDYFTSALPWPQKGDAVSVPLGTSAPIYGANMDFDGVDDASNRAQVLDAVGGNLRVLETDSNYLHGGIADSGTGQLLADLSNATAATINQLRQAFQIQRMLERDARGGTRYIEIIKAHFGVTSPDFRMQRPEFLGGGSTPINITPVAQTVDADAISGGSGGSMGVLGAMGVTAGEHGFTKSFTEHCVIIGLVSVRADLTYQQGLNRMFSRQTRYDFYWPALSHIGEQTVLNKEIYAQGTSADDDVFGYQERYAEYRYKPSIITGAMRSSAATPLDAWHLSQEFSSLPTLNDTFIQENPPVDRVIAVQTEPHFIFDSYIRMKCARPMPVYGVPGLIDHF